MHKKYNVLSLDPMYSPLHEKIGEILAKEKYTITSCYSKKIYLPRFKQFLATNLIGAISSDAARSYEARITRIHTYYHAYARKIQNRDLTGEEQNYMARFYLALEKFIEQKCIDLVILHNESHWQHAIAVDICRTKNIKYLITEQGLIRPFTTVIDSVGTNAKSNIKFNANLSYVRPCKADALPCVKDKHDSFKSMLFFSFFLAGVKFESFYGNKTIIRYMHNDYCLKKYTKRLFRRLTKKLTSPSVIKPKSVLLLLQLESDSQILIHSSFSCNQQVIDLVSEFAKNKGLEVAVKYHPLSERNYHLRKNCYVVDGQVAALANDSELVFTINSSASVDVLKTDTPLVLLGESIYDYPGIAHKIDLEKESTIRLDNIPEVNTTLRHRFLDYLKNDYLLYGAGYSYDDEVLRNKLKSILSCS